MLFAALYDKDDFLNVVTDFTIEQQKDGKEKANPKGAGKSLLRDDWMRSIRERRTTEQGWRMDSAQSGEAAWHWHERCALRCRCYTLSVLPARKRRSPV